MRFLAKKMAEKFENSFGGNPFQGFENTATNPREGEVSIDKNPTSKIAATVSKSKSFPTAIRVKNKIIRYEP